MFLPFIDFTVANDRSSMTFFGMFSYDSVSDSVKSSHIDMQIGGGLTELKRILKGRLTYFQDIEAVELGFLLVSLGLGIYVCSKMVNRYLDQKREKDKELASGCKKRCCVTKHDPCECMPGTPACVVCMENIATVIFSPCNHMLLCGQCFDKIKDSQTNTCPICRGDIDFDSSFEIAVSKEGSVS